MKKLLLIGNPKETLLYIIGKKIIWKISRKNSKNLIYMRIYGTLLN